MQFQNNYASYYDLLYHDKDYATECKYLENMLRKYSKGKQLLNVLDIACGTGSHAFHLARRGLKIVGSDISSDMISVAKTKKVSENNPRYMNKDMRKLGIMGEFDAVICMAASLNYIVNYQDLEQVLKGVRDNLKQRGIFFCDLWNGLAVLTQRPSSRIKYAKHKGVFLIRSSEPTLLSATQNCNVNFKLNVFMKGMAQPLLYEETHKTRFYFPEEMKYVLSKNGFEVLAIHPFMKPSQDLGESDWNMSIIARKI